MWFVERETQTFILKFTEFFFLMERNSAQDPWNEI